MFKHRKLRLTVLGSLIVILALDRLAMAQSPLLPDHVWVDAFGVGDVIYFDYTPAGAGPITGDGVVDTGPLSGSTEAPGPYAAEVHSRAVATASGLALRVRAASSGSAAIEFVDYFGSAVGSAQWRDIVTIGGGTPPEALRFNFVVDGLLSISGLAAGTIIAPSVSRSGLGVRASGDVLSYSSTLAFSTIVGSGSAARLEIIEGNAIDAVVADFWDHISCFAPINTLCGAISPPPDPFTYVFNGTFSVISSRKSGFGLPPTGGYFVSVGVAAGTDARGGSAGSDFFSTLTLESITLQDGSPLPDDLVLLFESGLEPPSPPPPTNTDPFADAGLDQTVECASPQGASIDLDGTGSFDPDGDLLSFHWDVPGITLDDPSSPTPSGVFPVGPTTAELTVSDGLGGSAVDDVLINVVADTTPPVVQCNAPTTIVPPDAPISFTATSTDNCGATTTQITAFDCFRFNPAEKRVDKTNSCVVSFAGDTLTITDTGGVDDTITWTVSATDDSGHTAAKECSVVVMNPTEGGGE